MPGRLFLTRRDIEVLGHRSPDLVPRTNIAPGQEVCALTSEGFQMMRWGLIPVGRKNARGRPVMETIVNARSETIFDKSAFDTLRRAVVPADGWYEWTGDKGRKTPWAITAASGELLWFAAVWDEWHGPGGLVVPQLATLTCPPNGDVRDIHHRMGVLLAEAAIPEWLNGNEAQGQELFAPAPDGSLSVRKNPQVDWSAP